MITDAAGDLRYAAHHALTGIGREGQGRITQARVALIGAGGLGCAAAQYLVSSGVGQLTLCDFDRVERSNLARQVLYTPKDIGKDKVDAARHHLQHLNPETCVETVKQRVDRDIAAQLAENHDICIDASDNYGTRLAMNIAHLATGKVWVMGSCIRQEGQLKLLGSGQDEACYRCIYGTAPESLEDCPGAGVFAPAAGIMGAAMAHLALQFIAGQSVESSLMLMDSRTWDWRKIQVAKNPGCPACGPE